MSRRAECAFLVADSAMEGVFKTFLGGEGAFAKLGTRTFTYHVIQTPGETDPDLFQRPDEVLEDQLISPETHPCVVVALDQRFDRGNPADLIRTTAKRRLERAGWNGAGIHIAVMEPELESWMWHNAEAPMRVVEAAFRYDREHRGGISLRNRLMEQKHWPADQPKPTEPKATINWARGQYRNTNPRDIFCEIVAKIGINHCRDNTFLQLRESLQRWFPPAWFSQP